MVLVKMVVMSKETVVFMVLVVVIGGVHSGSADGGDDGDE